MDEVWNARHNKLAETAKVAALALLDHVGGAETVHIPFDGRAEFNQITISLEKV